MWVPSRDQLFIGMTETAIHLDQGLYFLAQCSCLVFCEGSSRQQSIEVELLTRQECCALQMLVANCHHGQLLSALELGSRLCKAGHSDDKVAHSGQMIISSLRAKLHDWEHSRIRTVWGSGCYVLIIHQSEFV